MLTHHLDTQDDRLVVEQHLSSLRGSAGPRRGGITLRLRQRIGHGLVGLGLRVAGERRSVRLAPR